MTEVLPLNAARICYDQGLEEVANTDLTGELSSRNAFTIQEMEEI